MWRHVGTGRCGFMRRAAARHAAPLGRAACAEQTDDGGGSGVGGAPPACDWRLRELGGCDDAPAAKATAIVTLSWATTVADVADLAQIPLRCSACESMAVSQPWRSPPWHSGSSSGSSGAAATAVAATAVVATALAGDGNLPPRAVAVEAVAAADEDDDGLRQVRDDGLGEGGGGGGGEPTRVFVGWDGLYPPLGPVPLSSPLGQRLAGEGLLATMRALFERWETARFGLELIAGGEAGGGGGGGGGHRGKGGGGGSSPRRRGRRRLLVSSAVTRDFRSLARAHHRPLPPTGRSADGLWWELTRPPRHGFRVVDLQHETLGCNRNNATTSHLGTSDLDLHAPYCSPTRALGDRSFMVGNGEGPGGAVVAEGRDLFTCGQRDPPKK